MRLDIRRIGGIKEADGTVLGNHCRVKVVKNKVAPPFRQAEFDIYFDSGISGETNIIDLASKYDIIKKSGAWLSYNGEHIGQGREKTRLFPQGKTPHSWPRSPRPSVPQRPRPPRPDARKNHRPAETSVKSNEKDGPLPVNCVEEEYAFVSLQRCDCGGSFTVERQMLSGGDVPMDVLAARCAECKARRDFVFDISAFYGDMTKYGAIVGASRIIDALEWLTLGVFLLQEGRKLDGDERREMLLDANFCLRQLLMF